MLTGEVLTEHILGRGTHQCDQASDPGLVGQPSRSEPMLGLCVCFQCWETKGLLIIWPSIYRK